MAAQLTRDDMIALSLKWGRLYQPHEWVELERLYREMDEDFKLEDADSKANLILLCKTVLKQNQAIDTGDIDGYQKLSKVSEGLRKTMKLTAAQNKQDKGDVFDSIGEIIILCEK